MTTNSQTYPASIISKAFVDNYYNILHRQPEIAHGFYRDNSKFGRPDHNGNMSVTTTLKDINAKILSMNYSDLKVIVLWVDTQLSLGGGIKIVVTGFMIGMGNTSRNFIQVFFLAPMERGYFVLNDILRFLDQDSSPVPTNEIIVVPKEIDREKNADNVETVVHEEKIPPMEVVHELPKVKPVIDAKEVSLVAEVPNVETMVHTEEVPLVEVVHELPKVKPVIDAKEVPLVAEVPNVETMVHTEEVPLVDQVPNEEKMVDVEGGPLADEVLDVSCVVNAKEIPDAKVFQEVHDDSCVVNAKEIPLAKVVDEVLADADEVPLAEVPNEATMVDTEEVPLVDVVNEVPNVVTMVDAEEVPLVEVIDEILDVETVVDAEEIPLDEVVDKEPNVEVVVDAKEAPLVEVVDAEEVPLIELVEEVPNVETVVDAEEAPHFEVVETPNVETILVNAEEVPLGNVVDEVHDDSRVVEPNKVSLAKIIDESESKQDEVPNKSHASIEIGATSSSHALASHGIMHNIQEYQVSHWQPSTSADEVIPIFAEADHDYSIYIKCLPLSVTPSLLEEEFKRFGAIKSGGIQVKINKQGFCFGLVEFEEANSVQKALKASPVGICGRQIVVQEKRSSNSRGGRGAHRFRHDRTGVGGERCYDFPMRGSGSGRWDRLRR